MTDADLQRRPPGVTHWDGPGLEAWQAWRPEAVARRLDGIGVPWCVVGGWAIDLFLGSETRAHADLEIAILRADFPTVRARLHDCVLFVVGDGEVRRLRDGALPPEDKHQNWVLDTAANVWRMDVMLEPGDAHTWVFRRDERVSAPRACLVRAHDGIPCLAPEAVLLFKAKHLNAKDQADFDACLPHLDAGARTWLREALERVHPGHAWIARLPAEAGHRG
jgi:hypothetical protein